MHRTQLLLPIKLHQRVKALARRQRRSMGAVARQALTELVAREDAEGTPRDAVEALLLADPFHDPAPDPGLSEDHDHYLYGAPRRSKGR